MQTTVKLDQPTIKPKKRKFSKPLMAFTVLVQLALTGVIGLMLIFHGPFAAVRSYIVGTAMESGTHRYLATWFLSDEEINKIIHGSDGSSSEPVQQVAKTVSQGTNYSGNYQIDRITNSNYSGYMLIIDNPLRVHVGYTKYIKQHGELTSDMAKDHGAIAAINGGGFFDMGGSTAYAGNGAYPTKFVISGGQVIYQDDNFTDNEKTQVIGMDSKGNLIIGDKSINDLKKAGVTDALQFENEDYPTDLVVNGVATFKGDAGSGRTARTAIGQRKSDNAILLLVLDGRTFSQKGATLGDVRDIMLKYDAQTAAELDGGGSTTMVLNGKVINNPCNTWGERTVATSFYVEK